MDHNELNGFTLWRYRRAFRVGQTDGKVVLRSRTDGLFSELHISGQCVASDQTPAFGPDSVRNHLLVATLADGSDLEVEAGYVSVLNTGIAVRHKGEPIHESHPGRKIAYPEKYRQAALSMEGATLGEAMQKGFDHGAVRVDFGVLKRNWIPLTVDILLGLLFYVVAKLTDLTTAALVGAAVGLFLLVMQRLTKTDLLGGLALFGIVLLLLSAMLALAFQSDDAVKYRSSIIGLISAALFFLDGLAGGNRLSVRLMHYLPYRGIDAARLGIGMGLLGAILAGLNYLVAQHASTDIWLFYSTFADVVIAMVLITFVFRYAQGRMLGGAYPRYAPTDADDNKKPEA